MSTRRKIAFSAVALALAAAATISARVVGRKPSGTVPAPLRATRVTLAPVAAVTSVPREEITGSLQPAKALQLGFEVGGRLATIRVQRGATVREGQVVAQLHEDAALAQVREAEAALRAAQARAEIARDTADREGKLLQGGAVSELQARSSASQSRTADAQVQVAAAALDHARALLAKHTLRAPFAGTVIEAPDQVGAAVAAGAPLVTLEQLDTLTLRVTLPERARHVLRSGVRVRVETVSDRASTDEARVRTVVPSADATTRRVPVDITVPNRDGRFTAHTLARAVLPLGDERPASAVPATALVSTGGDHVFAVGPGGGAARLAVNVLDRGAGKVVLDRLPEGARVIDFPPADLAVGSQVEVKE